MSSTPDYSAKLKYVRITTLSDTGNNFIDHAYALGGIDILYNSSNSSYSYRNDETLYTSTDDNVDDNTNANQKYYPWNNGIYTTGVVARNGQLKSIANLVKPNTPTFKHAPTTGLGRSSGNVLEFGFDEEVPFTEFVLLPPNWNNDSILRRMLRTKVELFDKNDNIIASTTLEADTDETGDDFNQNHVGLGGVENVGARIIVISAYQNLEGKLDDRIQDYLSNTNLISDDIKPSKFLLNGRSLFDYVLLDTVDNIYVSEPEPPTLFFSEYCEGSDNNRYLEIFNPTDSDISLDDYAYPNVGNNVSQIGKYEWWNGFTSGAIISSKGFYIIAHPSADSSILSKANQTWEHLSDGDDGYKLIKKLDGATKWGNDRYSEDGVAEEGIDYEVVDSLGNWQVRGPWDVAGVSNATEDHTLVRKSSVIRGNSDWDASRGTNSDNSEWIVKNIDDFTNLGQHTILGITYQIPEPEVVSNICFPAGTGVYTDQGNITIEKLVPGLNTISNKEIVTITKTVMTDDKLVKIKKNAISKNIPNKDTTISGFHKVKINGKLIEAYKLVNYYKDIKYIPYNGEVLYNVLMENWETMKVHNMEAETLHPDNIVAKLHNSKISQDKKLQLLGEINKAVINEDYEKFDLIKNHILS